MSLILDRIKELRKNSKRNTELSDEEFEEIERLSHERIFEQANLIPRPTCCETAQNYPAITFSVNVYEPDQIEFGKWHASLPEKLWHILYIKSFDRMSDYIENMPEPKYCPFCGTALPKMQLKKIKNPDICRVTDGGYYCDTCKERLNACVCDPPEAAFEPVL